MLRQLFTALSGSAVPWLLYSSDIRCPSRNSDDLLLVGDDWPLALVSVKVGGVDKPAT